MLRQGFEADTCTYHIQDITDLIRDNVSPCSLQGLNDWIQLRASAVLGLGSHSSIPSIPTVHLFSLSFLIFDFTHLFSPSNVQSASSSLHLRIKID